MSVTFRSPTPALPAQDIERALRFYREVLGFETVHEDEHAATMVARL